jgi:hypothetical protein
MRRGAVVLALAAAWFAAGVQAQGGGDRLRSTRALSRQLAAAGRGEVAVTLTREDPMMGRPQTFRGTLALEPPDRVRLEFPETGERIAVRGDGGEWLQPSARQLIRLRPEQAGVASWLWDLFLHGGGGRFTEREAAPGRYALTFPHEGGALPETLIVTVDARGLPAALEVRDRGLGRSSYRFASWRFARARGAAAFVIQPPRGYTVLEESPDF